MDIILSDNSHWDSFRPLHVTAAPERTLLFQSALSRGTWVLVQYTVVNITFYISYLHIFIKRKTFPLTQRYVSLYMSKLREPKGSDKRQLSDKIKYLYTIDYIVAEPDTYQLEHGVWLSSLTGWRMSCRDKPAVYISTPPASDLQCQPVHTTSPWDLLRSSATTGPNLPSWITLRAPSKFIIHHP
jgi:hypothetical protein